LSDYLGFSTSTPASATLSLQTVQSNSIQTTRASDDVNAVYVLDASNNYFQIVQYSGGGASDPSANIIHTLRFTLPLSNGIYTRTALIGALEQVLTTSNDVIASNLERIYTSSLVEPIQYKFNLTIRLNRQKYQNVENGKIAVLFPTETISEFAIWTGTNACFQFPTLLNELSETIAPNNLNQTNYLIRQTPTVFLHCDLSGYDNSYNNYTITVANSPDPINGYSLNDYLGAINTAFHTKAVETSYALVDISAIVLGPQTSKPTMYIDINKIFRTANYNIDFTDSVLGDVFDVSFNGDISGSLNLQTTFVGQIAFAGQYSVPKNQPVCTITPGIPDLQNMTSYVVPFLPDNIDLSFNNSGSSWIYSSSTKLATDIATSLQTFSEAVEAGGGTPLAGCTIQTSINNAFFILTVNIAVTKVINQTNYTMFLYDISGGQPYDEANNSWRGNLFFDASYNLANQLTDSASSIIVSNASVTNNSITLVKGVNDYFFIRPLTDISGLTTEQMSTDNEIYYDLGYQVGYPYNYVRINLPNETYSTYVQLLNAINTALASHPQTVGTIVSTITQNGAQYVKFRWNINRTYTASDYTMVFYNNISFVKCYVGDSSVRNTTWDTTLGWILGFQESTEYNLSEYVDISGIATLEGDTAVNVNLYNYLLISLDDYNQNRLNDGVVTITPNEIKVPLPSYSKHAILSCDSSGNATANGSNVVAGNNLTANQIYSLNQILNSQQNQIKRYTTGPFVKDVFGTIPLKLNGLQNGQPYVEFGGTLQQQQRQYFGPVNLKRLSVTLYTDKGTILDLNNTNWSFMMEAEILYQKQKI
jgi:hypothetical protein